MTVLVVGDANVDLVLAGDVVPRFGQAEQLLDAASLVLGGSASIAASAPARSPLRRVSCAARTSACLLDAPRKSLGAPSAIVAFAVRSSLIHTPCRNENTSARRVSLPFVASTSSSYATNIAPVG